MENPEAQKE